MSTKVLQNRPPEKANWTFLKALKRVALTKLAWFFLGLASIALSELGFHHSSLIALRLSVLGAFFLISIRIPYSLVRYLLLPSDNEKTDLLKFFVSFIDCVATAATIGFMFGLRVDFLSLFPLHS